LPRGAPRLSQQEQTEGQTGVPEVNGAPGAPEADEPVAPVATTDNGGDDREIDQDAPVVLDDLGGQSLSDAIDATIVDFDEGGLVSGTVVKIDSDEVLLDIGYKSEGVIPSKELSIRNDVNPADVVSLHEQ